MLAAMLMTGTFAVAEAGPKKHVCAVTQASLKGTGAELVKKVKTADGARVLIFDQDGEWTVHYAIALASPLPAPELQLKISDVTRGKQALATRHKVVFSDAPVVRGSFKLGRDEVLSPNAKLMVEIASDGVPVANRTFFIQSKGAGAGGARTIDFSADEASAKDTVATPTVSTRRR